MAGNEIEMGHCIRNCNDCHTACLETVRYCLGRGGAHVEAAHLNLLLVCADICRVSADTMLRGADVHTVTCGACAEICERCASDCERMADNARMKRCAEICRRCADSCAAMAAEA
jgi:hypothetical protein